MATALVQDTITGDVVEREGCDARDMCAQADGRYRLADAGVAVAAAPTVTEAVKPVAAEPVPPVATEA